MEGESLQKEVSEDGWRTNKEVALEVRMAMIALDGDVVESVDR